MSEENQKDWMDEDTINWIKGSEQPIDHMYQDTTGNVTVGYGHMIKDANAAKSISFRYQDMNGRYATAKETEDAFWKVQLDQNSKEKNYVAQYYNPETSAGFDKLYLDNDEKDRIFREDLNAARVELENRKDIDFYGAPRSAKQALLDMQFNMGGNRFSEQGFDEKTNQFKPGWPKLFDAAKRGDWKTVGDESHRKDVPEERNDETRKLFYRAAEEKEGR